MRFAVKVRPVDNIPSWFGKMPTAFGTCLWSLTVVAASLLLEARGNPQPHWSRHSTGTDWTLWATQVLYPCVLLYRLGFLWLSNQNACRNSVANSLWSIKDTLACNLHSMLLQQCFPLPAVLASLSCLRYLDAVYASSLLLGSVCAMQAVRSSPCCHFKRGCECTADSAIFYLYGGASAVWA